MPVTLVSHKRRPRDHKISAPSSFIADTNSDLDFPAIEGGGATKKAQEHVSRSIEQWTEEVKRSPPQPSKRELEIAEAQTLTDIKWTAASAVVLYFSPHLVEYVSKLF
ncbi:hypothetical protein FB567DRAFT_590675 [Paraphoma chrysanthemicola]|uniref:Uncharacterized protein n=1 Tax=Paraphoma chrysanthemicola TaxID=798071 RepID=A0A8K0W047_9PLEO|nr:hypothetical protein FB567DRAFT_590675 [Paraphoma chrysanthemicola]